MQRNRGLRPCHIHPARSSADRLFSLQSSLLGAADATAQFPPGGRSRRQPGASGCRAVRRRQGRAAQHRGAQGRAAVARARRRAGRRWRSRRRQPAAVQSRHPADVGRRAALPECAALRSGDAPDVLHRVRECGLGGRAGGLQQHRRGRAGDGHRGWPRLPRRRRPLPRELVVRRRQRLQAIAEPDVRLRPRRPGDRRLPHAELPERQRRPDADAHGAVDAHRAAVHRGAEGQLRPRGHQRRELGHLRQRAAVQQGIRRRQLQTTKGTRWKIPQGGRGRRRVPATRATMRAATGRSRSSRRTSPRPGRR